MKSRADKLKSHSAEKGEDSEVSSVLVQSHRDESDNDDGGYWKWPTLEPATFQIPQQKWQDILADEWTCYVIDSCREEIIKSAMDKIYDIYLNRQMCPFVVHCSHLAWMQLFNWINLKYEPEEMPTPLQFWSRDKEQVPSPKDPWIFRNVAICRKSETLNPPDSCSITYQGDTVLSDVYNSSRLPSGDKSNELSLMNVEESILKKPKKPFRKNEKCKVAEKNLSGPRKNPKMNISSQEKRTTEHL